MCRGPYTGAYSPSYNVCRTPSTNVSEIVPFETIYQIRKQSVSVLFWENSKSRFSTQFRAYFHGFYFRQWSNLSYITDNNDRCVVTGLILLTTPVSARDRTRSGDSLGTETRRRTPPTGGISAFSTSPTTIEGCLCTLLPLPHSERISSHVEVSVQRLRGSRQPNQRARYSNMCVMQVGRPVTTALGERAAVAQIRDVRALRSRYWMGVLLAHRRSWTPRSHPVRSAQ